jgi:glycosyltransferase involved in cell wall biosynthesis
MTTDNLDLSFVVIGFNESAMLPACLASVKAADLAGLTWELIYVDGGSTDGSRDIALAAGVDQVLGGDRRRRAAENRNLGFASARGQFVQFLDGDMVLDSAWPRAALTYLQSSERVAAACGQLRERRRSVIYRAMEIDWETPEGPVDFCGGAALFRADAFRAAGGFPEDVAYGEEPLLCWRLRNQLGWQIHHLRRPMVDHDLAFKGFADYWRRTVRVGFAFAEIAHRCKGTSDPLWSHQVRHNLVWGLVLVFMVFLMVMWPGYGHLAPVLLVAAVLTRKTLQFRKRGWRIAAMYAVHTYLVKVAIAYGVLRWQFRGQQ